MSVHFDAARQVGSVGLLFENLIDLRMPDGLTGRIRFQVLFTHVSDIFRLLVFREKMVKWLVAAGAYVLGNGIPPLFGVAERRVDIENHPPEGINPMPDNLSYSEFCRSHGYSSAYCMHCRDTVSASCLQAFQDETLSIEPCESLKTVDFGKLRILGCDELSQVNDHLGLLPGRVVLHLAVYHHGARAVRHGIQDFSGEGNLVRVG